MNNGIRSQCSSDEYKITISSKMLKPAKINGNLLEVHFLHPFKHYIGEKK